jgi:hypothetical protein
MFQKLSEKITHRCLEEWGIFTCFKNFVEVIENETIARSSKKVPQTYKRDFPTWDKMGLYQKNVMINAWESASQNMRDEIRAAYFKKAGPNWNLNDWARLIHVAFDNLSH